MRRATSRWLWPSLLLFSVVAFCGGLHAYAVHDRSPPPPSGAAAQAAPGQQEEITRGLRRVRIRGEGYALGRAHGELLKDEVQAVVQTLRTQVVRSAAARDALLLKAWQLDARIPPRYREELRGVADGAQVAYADLLLVNTYDDLLHLMGCSSAVTLPRDGNPLWHGRNLDYPIAELARHKVVFDLRTRGVQLRVISFPGYIGVLTGMSSRGLGLSSHTSKSQHAAVGVPSGILYRAALEEATDLPGLVEALRAAPRTIGNNLALSDAAHGAALAVELSPKQLATRPPKGDRLLVTNHYQIAALQAEQPKALFAPASGSVAREGCLARSLPPGRPAGLVDVQAALAEETPKGLRAWRTPANVGTVQSVVMQPATGELWVAKGLEAPVTRGGYTQLPGLWASPAAHVQ